MAHQVTVGDLAEITSWKLALLAGGRGLDRAVTWAHVFDVADPGGWVDGGELVIITGVHFPAQPADQVEFLRRLETHHAAGLAIGFLGPPICDEFLAEADELSFPIFRVPRETAHLPIVKFVAAANAGEVQQKLVTAIRVFETLAPRDEDMEPWRRFQQIEKITGYELYVVSTRGKALMSGFKDLPPELLEDVKQTKPSDARWTSLAIPNGYACPITVAQRLAGFLVAQERPDRTAAGLGTFRHIETITRLDVSSLYSEREVVRRKGAELLGRYLHGAHPSQRSQDSRDGWGTNFEHGLVLAAISVDPSAPIEYQVDREIHHQLVDRGTTHLLLTENERTLVAMRADDIELLDELAADLPIQVGVSAIRGSLIDAAVARREASWAERHGRKKADGHIGFFRAEEEEWAQWLPADPPALTQLVKNTLGPILEYDEQRDAGLMTSLEVYFAHEGRLQSAADQLHIHKHTLSYRLKRIEALTGRDLNSLRDRSQLWLALSASEVVSEPNRVRGSRQGRSLRPS